MMKQNLFLIALLSLYSCEAIKFSDGINIFEYSDVLRDRFIQIVKNSSVTDDNFIYSITSDNEGNIYHFGITSHSESPNQDFFIQKQNKSNSTIWRQVINNDHPLIDDSSLDEMAASLLWNKETNSLIFVGHTKSSMRKINDGNNDLIIGSMSLDGELKWLHQLSSHDTGITSTDGFTNSNDQAGFIKENDKGEVFISFQTNGSLFDDVAGGFDSGIFQINPLDGTILNSIQLGVTTLQELNIRDGSSKSSELDDNIVEGNFDFDGDKIILPIRTKSNIGETNAGDFDASYVVLDSNLNIISTHQLGVETFSEWALNNSFPGDNSLSNQIRSVAVLAAGDYLFYGKTIGSLASESAGLDDLFFMRYKDNKLISLVQYGIDVFPNAKGPEQPRHIYKDKRGNIFVNGHTMSQIFNGKHTNIRPFVFKVNKNGELISGVQLSEYTSTDINFKFNYVLTSHNFIVTDKEILIGSNNAKVGLKIFDSYLWKITPF